MLVSGFMFLVSGLMFQVSCAKKEVEVGRENPEVEIQKCMKYSEKKQFEDAVECLEIFKSHFPKSQWGIEAEMMIGDNYFRKGEYILAAESYLSFLKLHPMHPKADYAYYKVGLSYLYQSPKALDRDQEYLDDAIQYFELVLRSYPNTPYLSITKTYLLDARTRMAKRNLYVGRFYYRTGEYIAAVPRFEVVYDNYKDTGLGEKALNYSTLSNIKLNRFEAAKANYSLLLMQYPGSKYIPKLQKRLIQAAEKRGAL